jgi:uncharacterized protein YjiS (DUF1127 family)
MATIVNLPAQAPGFAAAAAGSPDDGERDGSGEVPGDYWQGITLQSFHVGLHPGLRRVPPVAKPRAPSHFVARMAVRLMFRSRARITALMRAVASRRQRARSVAAPQRLDDITLKDLGICRCEIEYVVQMRASGKWRE